MTKRRILEDLAFAGLIALILGADTLADLVCRLVC